MRIYLDNCCFNRPFDNQNQNKIKQETSSVLIILKKIADNEIELVWSYMLDYENSLNPYPERKNTIAKWKKKSQIDIKENKELLETAEEIRLLKISSEDCIHVACSVNASCDYFITTDNVLVRKLRNYNLIKSINPVDFILKEDKSND